MSVSFGKVLRPFFGFYGGKWRETPRYYPAPTFDTIVEPFAGSAGYSLRYYWKRVILCEIDPYIAGVWRYLKRAKPREILRLPDLAPGSSVDDLAVCQEAKWLIGFWLNRGVATPRKRPSRWMRDGVRPGSFWGERVRQTIASQVDEIRHWEINECSYDQVSLRRRATWFIDPPYVAAGKHYRYDSTKIDYDHLAQWCLSRKGQVIVCEHANANWLDFKELGHTKTTRRGRRSPEVWWYRENT